MNLKDFDRTAEKLRENYRGEMHALLAARDIYIKEVWPKYVQGRHYVASDGWAWDCTQSPFKYCVYDTDEDPSRDDCLFCGDPEERK